MNLRLAGAAVAALVLLGAVGVFWPGDDAQRALYVQPQEGPFRVTVTTTGELQAQNSVQITGPAAARRARIYQMEVLKLVEEGTVVEKGDFVAELDRSELNERMQDIQLELQKVRSQVEQAQIDTALTLSEARDQQVNLRYAMEEVELRKEQAQYEAPSVRRQADIDYEKAERSYRQAVENYKMKTRQAEAQMREAEAELVQARRELEQLRDLAGQFTIRAPEQGMLIYHREGNGRKVKAGSTVRVWDPVVATLPDLSVMESITYVNEVDIQKVRVGQPVEIGLDADPAKRLTGTVTSVANIGEQRANSDAKVFEVKVEVSETDTTLRPAMTTSNTIVVDEQAEAVHVPLEAVHAQGDSLAYVFMQRGGGVAKQQVELGLISDDRAVVTRGATPSDRLHLSTPADTTGLALQALAPEADAPDTDEEASEDDAPLADRDSADPDATP
jgi:multidrug resistance efflux pump